MSASRVTEVSLRDALGSQETYEAFQNVRRAALGAMLEAIERDNHAELAAMCDAWSWDLTLVPSTPAWTGWNPLTSGGRLAVVGDRIVFFSERLWGDSKVVFVMRGSRVKATLTAKPWLGSVALTLREGEAKRRLQLTPPRGVKLKQVSAPAEEPGWSEVVRELRAGLGDLTDPTGGPDAGDLLGTVGEAVHVVGEVWSMVKDYRIAATHLEIWRELLDRLSRGESAPFGARRPTARKTTRGTASKATPKSVPTRRSPVTALTRASAGTEPATGESATEDLVALVAARTQVPERDAAIALDVLVQAVATELQQTGRPRVPRLGTLAQTSRSLSFRPTIEFRDAVARGR